MADMLTRPLQDNRVIRQTGVFDLNVSLGAALGQVASQPMMTELAGQNIAMGQAAGESLYRLDVDLEQRLLDVQDRAFDLPQGPDRDALMAEATDITRQMRQGGTALGQQIAIDSGAVVSVEDLENRYQGYGLRFDRPMTEEEAALLAQSKRAEIIRETIINAAPQGVLPAITKFGAGIVAMATDPLELASMFIPVVGQAGRAAATARFGRVGGTAAVGAIEGLVGSALTEPIYAELSRSMQMDYDMSDSLMNIGLGFALGGGLGSLAGVLGRREGRASPDAPEIERVDVSTPEVATARAEQVAVQREMTAAQRPAADAAVRQFVNDTPISVAALARSLGIEKEISLLNTQIRKTMAAPVVNLVKGLGRIDPEGYVASELRNADITPKTYPSLFKRGGLDFIDNKVADELEDALPGISDNVRVSNGYLDQDDFIQAIIDDIQGNSRFTERADLEGMREDAQSWKATVDHLARYADENGFVIRTKEEIERIAEALARNDNIDDVLAANGVRKLEDYGPDFARHASNDVLSDADASEQMAEAAKPVSNQAAALDESISEWREMYDQMADDLTPAMRAEVDEAMKMKQHAAAYAEVAEAAAICMARA